MTICLFVRLFIYPGKKIVDFIYCIRSISLYHHTSNWTFAGA